MKPASSILVLALALGLPGTEASADDATVHFRLRVLPLLQARCIQCHGADQQKARLRLDSRDHVLRGGDLGPAVVPGNPSRSLLLQAVLHTHPDLEMPPKDKLSDADLAVFDRWIRDGAPWPHEVSTDCQIGDDSGTPQRPIGDAWSDADNPIVRLFQGRRLDLWSLQPIGRPEIPGTASAAQHPIDRFIRAGFSQARLTPAPPAGRRSLVRRLSFDLTGMPPSPELAAAFARDVSADAYERLVDRLIADPRFGEHQARQWLDVVRYSDSNGFDWDEFRPQAWRYRDYVIRSFNADKPFDQFVREQVAGDELVEGPPRDAAGQDCLVATGFLRIGPQDNSASLFNEQARARAEWMADVTETTGSAFLGLTFNCCRCHDHKFDPLSQADYFRLRAFFEPLKYGDELALDLASDFEALQRQHSGIDAQIGPLKDQREAVKEQVRRRVRTQKKSAQLTEHDRRAPSDAGARSSSEPAAPVGPPDNENEPSDDELIEAATEEEKKVYQELSERIERLEASKERPTRGLLATDSTEPVPATRILFQGNPAAEREAVQPGIPSVFDPNPTRIRKGRNARTTGRRLTLADWIASPANPLTARVHVNRVWQGLFGRGLVATPNDFGLAGARPTHPELLDWLACEFVESGWSVKRLIRLIVTSATYRQSVVHPEAAVAARVDANNQLLWRQNLRRLSAEQLRDAVLAVSGLLREHPGGTPVWPVLPSEILQANPAFLDDNAEKTKGWYPSPPLEQTVRSLYLVQKRTVRLPFLETFDQPENSVSCPVRSSSIVAPQALSLFNGQETLAAAKALARRIEHDGGPNPLRRVEHAFLLTLQRRPNSAEADACLDFLRRHTLTELCRALVNLNEFAFVD